MSRTGTSIPWRRRSHISGTQRRRPPFVLNKDSPQAEGLVGFWPLYPPPGLEDLTGYNRGINTGTTTVIDREMGQVIRSDADGELIDLGTNSTLDVFGANQDFSFFAWINMDGTTTNRGIFSSGNSSSTGLVWFIAATSNDLRFRSVGNTISPQGSGPTAGTWSLCGGTADRDGNFLTWVDAAITDTTGISATAAEDWNRGATIYKLATARSTAAELKGVMTHAVLYNRVVPTAVIERMHSPNTRWDLYYELGRVFYSPPAAAAGATRGQLLTTLGVS